MTDGDNYARYRGYNNGGTRKIEICIRLAEMMNAAGVVKSRTAEDVKKKIETIENQMRRAIDWETSVTGAGLMHSSSAQDRKSFKDELENRCEYYDMLLPIFGDRVGSAPAFTSGTIFDERGAVAADRIAAAVNETNRVAHRGAVLAVNETNRGAVGAVDFIVSP